MGISQGSLLSSLEFLNKCDLSDPMWTKVLEKGQCIRRRSWLRRKQRVNIGGHIMRKERCKSSILERFRRSSNNEVERKVKILQKLIPKCESSSMGLERLFRETAEYVCALELRVKVMQIIVNVLSAPDSN